MAFSKIFGHQGVIDRLINVTKNNLIPSAYLFVGQDGIGKSTIASEFAQLMNCHDNKVCHNCNNCKMFDAKTHPDFLSIEPSGQFIKISQIKDLIKQLSLKPIYAQKRVVVIHNADKLNLEAANCFLKVLEEPPLDTTIILLTADENLLLETIVSRCQKVSFAPLTEDQLTKIYDKFFEIPEDLFHFVLKYSHGSIRKEFIKIASELYNIRSLVLNILSDLTHNRMIDHFFLLEQWVKKDKYHAFLEFLSSWLKDLILLSEEKQAYMLNADLISDIPQHLKSYSREQFQHAFDLVIETELAIRRNASKQLALESLLIQIKQVFSGRAVV